jgi:Family of unknown function (DUF6130)
MRPTTSRTLRAAIVGLAITALAVACQSDPSPPSPSTPATASARPSSTAELSILSPKQNQVIHGTTAPIDVKLTGATVVSQTSTDLQPDEGHLHVILDDQLVSMTSSTESVLTELTPGTHLLKVEFVANDHAPFDPRVIAAVTFEVQA